MGKSLGLGSIAIAHTLQVTDRRQRYKTLFDEAGDWATGDVDNQHATAIAETAKRVFQQWLLDAAADEQTPSRLDELPRIQTLLTLLTWQGPAAAKTQYMTELRADFAKRKVLPRAEVVAGIAEPKAGGPSPRQQNRNHGNRTRDNISDRKPKQSRPRKQNVYRETNAPSETTSSEVAKDIWAFLQKKRDQNDD